MCREETRKPSSPVVALKYPLVERGICIACLIVYLKPEPPEAGNQISRSAPR
jgi:hypothetical protein